MKRPRLRRMTGLFATSLAILVITLGAHATTVVPLDFEQLTAMSSLVVRAEVSEARSVEYNTYPYVFTETTVRIEATAKGDAQPGETVLIRTPGGRTEQHAVQVPGMPTLQLGERVVLFAEPLPAEPFGDDAPAAYIPSGLEQGVWRSVADERWQPRLGTGEVSEMDAAGQTGRDERNRLLAATWEQITARVAAIGETQR